MANIRYVISFSEWKTETSGPLERFKNSLFEGQDVKASRPLTRKEKPAGPC